MCYRGETDCANAFQNCACQNNENSKLDMRKVLLEKVKFVPKQKNNSSGARKMKFHS